MAKIAVTTVTRGPEYCPKPIKSKNTSIVIRLYSADDAAGVISLYQTVFNESLLMADLQWKYGGCGASALAHVAETDAGELVGFYGGLIRPLHYEGRAIHFSQAVDVMVRQSFRGTGVFKNLAQEHFCELQNRGVKVLYGFPTQNHFTVGEKKLQYERGKAIPVHERTISKKDISILFKPKVKDLRFVKVKDFDARADVFWEKIKKSGYCGLARDSRYLNWRYSEQPGADFDLFLAEDAKSGEPRGVLVTGCSLRGKSDGSLILWEILTAPKDKIALCFLIQSALRQALLKFRKRLVLWMDGGKFPELGRMGFRPHESAEPFLAFKFFDPTVNKDFLKENFCYTIGDSDLWP